MNRAASIVCLRVSAGLCAAMASASTASAQCPPTFTATTWGMSGTPALTVVGDFNNDGKLDLAAPNFSSHNVTVRMAAFNAAPGTNYNTVLTLPTGFNPTSMVAADLNADGFDDLAVAYMNGGAPRIGVFISNGNGTFQAIANYAPTPISTQIKGVDINHDGITDIVALAVNNLLVLPGHAGAWPGGGAEAFSVRPVTTANGSFFTVADFNADGAFDMLTTGGDPGRVFMALGAPPASATFGTTVTYGSGPVYGTGWPTQGDMNNDGVMDLIVTHQITNARIQVMLGSTGGTLTPLTPVITGNASPRCAAVADFNGDGNLDAVCVHNSGVGVHMGDGQGGLGAATNFTVSQPSSLTTADMNNDGKIDIIVASQTLGSYTILMNTTPVTTFNPVPFSQTACPGGGSTVQFAATATTTQSGGITGYTWQRLVGGTWTSLSNGPLAGVGTVSGATTQQITIAGVQGVAGDRVLTLRAVANTSCGGNPSAQATLDLIEPCGAADLGGPGGMPTPCGGDGVLDNNDFIVFINYFFEASMIADFGVAAGFPGQDGLLDNNDFVAFIDAFFGGCTN